VILLEAALGLLEPPGPRPRDRTRLPRAALIQAPARVAQPALPALRRGQLLGQLVPARVAEALVLLGVDGVGLLEDLVRDLLVIARGVMPGVGVNLGAIDRDHADPNQVRFGAQPQHLAEQLGQCRLMALAKARDRRVIRGTVGTDHPRGDVLDAAALDPPRRTLPNRVAVEQQRHHHRWLVRRTTLPVEPIAAIEPGQVQPLHRVDNEPREVPRGHPLAEIRRQLVRKGGRVAVISIPMDDARIPIQRVVLDEIDFVGMRATAGELPMAATLAGEGRIRLKELITHRFALDDFAHAYTTFTERRDGALKVIVRP
jgi:hypothetical protein